MKSTIYTFLALLPTLVIASTSLKDYTPYNYEVLFTNPVCKTYHYETPVRTNTGELVSAKTKNAYCKSYDSRASAKRKNSPHTRMVEWIKDSKTEEIFMAYLSFSKKSIAKVLCEAIRERNVKVTLIYDSNNQNSPGRMATGNYLSKCTPKNVPDGEKVNYPKVLFGGNVGGLGYAHNKLFFINPFKYKGEVKIAFGSGNMSSGVVTHHENWHFITTNAKSYFVKAHQCLKNALLSDPKGKSEFKKDLTSCQQKISVPEEDDIKTYFVPAQGHLAMEQIKKSIKESNSLSLAAHRFSNKKLIAAMTQALKDGVETKFIADDDLYWTGVLRHGVGRNMRQEYYKMHDLEKLGMKARFIETYADDLTNPRSLQLQHNKFIIFDLKDNSGAIFAGAGNLTISAFNKNFENFYYITIPEVYTAFKKQYDHMWNNLARSEEMMPVSYELP